MLVVVVVGFCHTHTHTKGPMRAAQKKEKVRVPPPLVRAAPPALACRHGSRSTRRSPRIAPPAALPSRAPRHAGEIREGRFLPQEKGADG